MAEVFISYSQKDRGLVAPFAACLGELGVQVWFDREISAGESFGAVIRARLKEAKAVIVCWSPEAIESKWVDAEAEYAREVGAYVPVFITPCALLPPFNTIHADDLSKWKGEANDPAWIRLIGRIAKLIGREGVAAAARVLANGDEQARYDFARRYPDEPAARKIWSAAEANHREHFRQQMLEAKAAAEAKINTERASLEARLKAVPPAFELWLADERRATEQGPPPDPLDLIEDSQPGEDPRLRDEIAGLHETLARAKAKENELHAAKAEITRLSGDLATFKAREALEPAEYVDHHRLRDEIATLQNALTKAESREAEFDASKAEAAGLSVQLAAARAKLSRFWALVVLIGLVAAGAGALAGRSVQSDGRAAAVAELEDLRHESDGLKAQIEAADKKQTETQARADWLAKELEDARANASNLERELAAADVKPGTQAPTAAQAPPVSANAGKQTYLVVDTFSSRNDAEANLPEFDKRCRNYKLAARIVRSDELDGRAIGNWEIVLGPYPNTVDLSSVWDGLRNCGSTPSAASSKRP